MMKSKLRRRSAIAAGCAAALAVPLGVTVAATPAYAVAYGKIYSLVSTPANCMDVTSGSNGPFQSWPFTGGCQNGDTQQWSYLNGSQTITSGVDGGGVWCLDVAYGDTDNGTPVGLYPCNGDDPAQKWVVVGQSLVNPRSGRCLDDPSGETGRELQIWDCNIGGNADQNWDIVGYQ
jgi:hypothetical protein